MPTMSLEQIWMGRKLAAPLARPRSARTRLLAHWFGLTFPKRNIQRDRIDADRLDSLLPRPGEVVLITGPSGAGKSSLVRALRRRASGTRWIDLNRIELLPRPVVDCLPGLSLEPVLSLLGKVGLSEAWTYLRKPSELSAGQEWRLRLAVALHRAHAGAKRSVAPDMIPTEKSGISRDSIAGASAPCTAVRTIIVCDEFAALLDRVTAAVIAHSFRRALPDQVGAILATAHDDLLEALQPDVHVFCDFGSVRVDVLQAPGKAA